MAEPESSAQEHVTTVPSRVKYFSTKYPDKEILVFRNNKGRIAFTWKQIYNYAGRFAWMLKENGFQRYDVIANTLPNSPERFLTDLGIVFAGCTPMNGQILLADGEDFFSSARVSVCKGVILCPKDDQPAWKLFRQYTATNMTTQLIAKVSCEHAPELTSAILVTRDEPKHAFRLIEELRSASCMTYVADLDPNDVVYVFTTSGSTGFSKLVPRSHKWVVEIVAASLLKMKNPGADNFFNDRPLGWGGGYPASMFAVGQKRILFDNLDSSLRQDRFGELAWTTITEEDCQFCFLLSSEFKKVHTYVKSQGEQVVRKRMNTQGGQPTTKRMISEMLELFESVRICYGSTECGMLSQAVLTDLNFDDYYCGKWIHKDEDIRVMNKQNEKCKPGELGHIWVKGDDRLVFSGYFNRVDKVDEQTIKAFTSDGWFDVEDVGYVDKDGNVFIIGRGNDVIMYGSFCVYPGWLEKKLSAHPDIAEIIIVPVSDPVLSHDICACVLPMKNKTLNEDNLRQFSNSIFVTGSDEDSTPVPKFYMILEDFPRTATGKTNRKHLKEMAEERFGQVSNLNSC